MRLASIVRVTLIAIVAICQWSACAGQSVVVRRVEPRVPFPFWTDCNSPCHWDGDRFYCFNSASHPKRSSGFDQFSLGNTNRVEIDTKANGGRWIECTWRNDDDGVLYAWYHLEPAGVCPGTDLTAPKVGALRSTDNGGHWTDLGIIMEAPADTMDCTAKNGYFAGGNGDFSCMLDKKRKYMYFFFDSYGGALPEQGVCVARMAWRDRDRPVGKVWKLDGGKWDQPGLGGKSTAVFPVKASWMLEKMDAFWGPSIHWNTYLQRYVMLLNHANGPKWKQEGLYITYGKSLSDPKGWTEPVKIANGGMYVQVIGIDSKAKETDKLCGRQGRLYIAGASVREIIFMRDKDDRTKLPPVCLPPRPELVPKRTSFRR